METTTKTNTLSEAFLKLKSNLELNPTFDTIIQQRHKAVRDSIERNGQDFETQLIGSLQKKTRIQPRQGDDFDIDILVILGQFSDWVEDGTGISPADASETLRTTLNQSNRYSSMNPEIDQPTVTFEYKDDIRVELVPGYLDNIGRSPNGTPHSPRSRAFWIPKHGRWELADYNHDAAVVSSNNLDTDGWFIPAIKMLKAIRRTFFPELDTFHLEILASKTIPHQVNSKRLWGLTITYPELITQFFSDAYSLLDSEVSFDRSNSPAIILPLDQRVSVKEVFRKIHSFCTGLDQIDSEEAKISGWKKLFGDEFPGGS